MTIPGGPHIEHLKKGDIVFSAKQTEDLIKHGRTSNHARVVGGNAFANGTTNGMRAYSSGAINIRDGIDSSKRNVNIEGDNNTVVVGDGKIEESSSKGFGAGHGQFTTSGEPGFYVEPPEEDDNDNGGGDSGGGDYGGGDDYNGNTELEDGSDQDSFSKEIFDYVEIRLKYFADATKKIADKITQYVDKVTKGKLLREEISALQDEIDANSQAAASYRDYATKHIAWDYTYEDNGSEHHIYDLYNYFNLDDLENGKIGEADIAEFETTHPTQKAYADAARAYIEYINKAKDADSAVQSLTNTMRDLYSQIIKLPTEKLEKALETLERRIASLSGVTDTISTGLSGVASAQRWLGKVNDQTNTTAAIRKQEYLKLPTYMAQNNYLTHQLNEKDKELEKQNTAQTERRQNQDELNRKVNERRNQINFTEQRLRNEWNGMTTNQQNLVLNAFKDRSVIDASQMPKYLQKLIGEWNTQVADYNTLNSAIEENSEEIQKGKEELAQTALELAQMEQQNAQQAIQNISNWFESEINFLDNTSKRLQKTREYWKEIGSTSGNINSEITLYSGIQYGFDKDGYAQVREENSSAARMRDTYTKEIENTKKIRAQRVNEIKEMEKELNKQVKNGVIIEGSEEWKKIQNQIEEAKLNVQDLDITIDQLYDSMREDVYWKAIDNLIKKAQTLKQSIESIAGTISSEMMYTEEGQFTDLGIARYSMDVKSLQAANTELDKIELAIRQLEEDYANGEGFSYDEYMARLTELQSQEQQAFAGAVSARQQIIKDITDRYQTEINYINKLIDARKKEIEKKKQMYQYDKQLKKKNKEIQLIEQQIRALNSLTDSESKAQKARLEAQRQDLQEELDETVMEHVVDLRIDGLSDLSEKLQENFDKFVQELNTSMDAAAKLVVDSQNNLSKCLESVDNTLRLWVSSINENVSLKQGLGIDVKSSTDKQVDTNSKKKDQGYINESHGMKENKPNDTKAAQAAASNYHVMDNGEILLLPDEEEDAELYEVYGPYWDAQKKKNYYEEYDFKKKKYVRNYNAKYAKGTTNAKGGMSLVNDGPGHKTEMIITKQGILLPLAPGDGVIPGDLTENLMKLAKNGGLPMQMPEIKMPDINTNQIVNSNADIHFDTLIRVDGNLDEKVLPSIEEIAKQLTSNKNFKQNIYNYTSKEMAKDMRKAGY